MTREQLADQHRAVVQRHYRTIADHDGRIPQAMLDDLATVAEQHATDVVGELLPPVETDSRPARRARKPATTE